ncbi:glucan 1,4-alpha-glucosidase [Shewanella cyperi]|uniref:Glucan 1,4-alpha-glucosidase n=1 Tax=Shewanella cyperi TaxID=2814292 RepID=A0A974XJQ3_9GAMM|nr:glucan 1,4-alpha-glucosidase [Shewanella cyperi]QSX28523.1 glucan 1,4-alpha-glucosidase [Shewanella cyperi]
MKQTKNVSHGALFRPSLAALSLAVAAALTLGGCEQAPDQTQTQSEPSAIKVAPGAPGAAPTWAFAGKTGIGTSYEPYGAAPKSISKVWFSIANGVLTETMYGLIHNAQLKELQFVIKGQGFTDLESQDTDSSISYLDTDAEGRPQSLAYRVVNLDKDGAYRIEKHIFTDPDLNSLIMRTHISALTEEITPFLYANPHIDNSGNGDLARVVDGGFMARKTAQESSVMTLKSSLPFAAQQVGFVGSSDGLDEIRQYGELKNRFQTTSADGSQNGGNVAMTGQYPSIKPGETLTLDLVLGFADDEQSSSATAAATLAQGYDQLLANFKGEGAAIGWQDYLASLQGLPAMVANTADNGKLLTASAMVLKAQEDKTHAGALIASLSNPWGDTVSAAQPSTGYKAVWPRDFYQCAMAFLAMGDTATAKVAFEYLKQVQAGANTPGYQGTPGWFLQKTHVDGQTEWVGVQLDQTAMPIMLGWKLWQAGVLSDDEIRSWYKDMLKSAADFLVTGGEVNIDWNHINIVPPKTQQERWEEQAGFSPSTTAAVITGLHAAVAIAEFAGDSTSAEHYSKAAQGYRDNLEHTMVTRKGTLSDKPYYVRLSPNGQPDAADKLADNNGRPGLDQRQILDGGFLELVRYGVTPASDPVINNTLALMDSNTLEDSLRLRYEFTAKDGSSFPGFRRYGNDGYGEDTQSGANYAESGSNSANQRGRVWPFFTGERGHFELAALTEQAQLSAQDRAALVSTYVQGMESFANEGLMLPEQVWDGVGNSTRFQYQTGQGTNSATPLAWTHAEYVKLVRSITDGTVWDKYPQQP